MFSTIELHHSSAVTENVGKDDVASFAEVVLDVLPRSSGREARDEQLIAFRTRGTAGEASIPIPSAAAATPSTMFSLRGTAGELNTDSIAVKEIAIPAPHRVFGIPKSATDTTLE